VIPIAKPLVGEEEKKAVAEVIDSGMIAKGPKCTEFEEAFQSHMQVKHAISTTSGTTALHIALLACGVGPGDEVITTPFSFIATATSIAFCGAKPVFVDIEPDTFNLDARLIEAAITPRTKAIMPVHLYGQCADMEAIMAIAKKHGLKVVEDACQAHSAKFNGRYAGGLGDAAGFSFYPTKNMTASEGGMATTNDPEIARRMDLLRQHGMARQYGYEFLGFNYRMTDVAAAIGLAQLEKLDGFNSRRDENAIMLSEGLRIVDQVTVPEEKKGRKHVWHQYTIRAQDRDRLREHLNGAGIGSGVYYPEGLHTLEPLKKVIGEQGPFPVTDQACREVLSLPVHPALGMSDVREILDAIKGFYGSPSEEKDEGPARDGSGDPGIISL